MKPFGGWRKLMDDSHRQDFGDLETYYRKKVANNAAGGALVLAIVGFFLTGVGIWAIVNGWNALKIDRTNMKARMALILGGMGTLLHFGLIFGAILYSILLELS